MIPWRQQYADPVRDETLGILSAVEFDPDEDMTLKQYADDTDINSIMRRFGVTGQLQTVDRKAIFGDFTGVSDYQEALNLAMVARDEFERLPPLLRKELDNSPAQLERWLSDPANYEQAVKLGLVDRPVPVEPISVRVLATEDATAADGSASGA